MAFHFHFSGGSVLRRQFTYRLCKLLITLGDQDIIVRVRVYLYVSWSFHINFDTTVYSNCAH